jgi:hypothetical protein
MSVIYKRLLRWIGPQESMREKLIWATNVDECSVSFKQHTREKKLQEEDFFNFLQKKEKVQQKNICL